MKRPEHLLDEHGFPIPPKFDQGPPADPQQKPAGRRGRWVLVVLLLLVAAALVVESPLITAGRRAIGKYYLGHAEQKHLDGDLPGALAEIDSAMEYLRDEPLLYEIRCRWRLEAKDLEGSLADFTRVIEMDGKWAHTYVNRGYLYLRMGRQRQAPDEPNQAVKYRAARDSELYNARAYGRALAGVELKEALEDVEKAIQFDYADHRLRLNAPSSDAQDEEAIRAEDLRSSANPSFLDTRGYILYLQGKYDLALKDMNVAIKRTEAEQSRLEQIGARPDVDKRKLSLALKEKQETLAVMYHHRGQIHEKLGDAAQAKSDLRLGDKLGYNPAEGVF